MTFRIVIPAFNVAPYIAGSIAMLRDQSHSRFTCTLIDDCSTDDTARVVRAAIRGDSRFDLCINREKKYALRNTVEAVGALPPSSTDVVVSIDGDDGLNGPDVLACLAACYAQRDVLLTYGSYINEHGRRGKECAPYPPAVLAAGRVRRAPWHATHLKSFSLSLWPHVPDRVFTVTPGEVRRARRHALLHGRWRAWLHWGRLRPDDYLDPSGGYVRRCFDRALMFPLLERARLRSRYIEQPLYRYRSTRPGHAAPQRSAAARWGPRCVRAALRLKPPLPSLTRAGEDLMVTVSRSHA